MLDTAMQDLVYSLVNTGRTWAGDLPSELPDTRRGRVQGAAFSVLVTIDGDSGAGPIRISPKSNPDVDLGGLALHEVFDANAGEVDDAGQRELLVRMWESVEMTLSSPHSSHRAALGAFMTLACRMLAEYYEIRLVVTDEDGYGVGVGDDLAPGLVAAFTEVWSRN